MNYKPRPWQSALLATSAISAALVAASQLWQVGHPQWAFLVAFAATWVLLAISWSNVAFTDRSTTILARIVDRNFEQLHDRLEALEFELETLRNQAQQTYRKAS